MEQKIKAAVMTVRRRKLLLLCWNWFTISFFWGTAGAAFLLFISRWYVVPHYRLIAVVFIVASLLMAVIIVWLRRPGFLQTVRFIDRSTEDRVGTALKYSSEGSKLAQLQRTEATEYAERFAVEAKQHIPFRFNWLRATGVFLSIFVFLLLWLYPNPHDVVLAERKQLDDWVEQQIEEIETWQEEELQSQADYEEDRLEWSRDWDTALTELREGLEVSESAEEVLENLDLILDQMENWLDEAERHLSDDRVQNEEQSPGQTNDQQNNDNSGEAGESGSDSTEERRSNLQEWQRFVTEKALNLAQRGENLAEALAAENASISESWREGTRAEAFSQQAGQTPQEGAGNDDDSGSSSGQEGGESSQAPDASGNGNNGNEGTSSTDANEGEGEQGNGTGDGSINGSGDGQQGGQQGGFGTGSRNEVSTPRILEGEGTPEFDEGPIAGEGGQTQFGGSSPGTEGHTRPYEEVYGQYEQEARQSMDRSTLPDNVRHLVRDYFLLIQPEGNERGG